MKTAVSRYKVGKLINANETSYYEVKSLKLICPECLKPVIRVVREKSCYFAHYPKRPRPIMLFGEWKSSPSLPIVRMGIKTITVSIVVELLQKLLKR